MTRPSLDETWSRVAEVVALRGTCTRLQVGAVLTRDSRIVSTGWNGAPAGMPHCSHDGTEQRCTSAVHAERNVIGYAARRGIATDGTTLYVSHAPCRDCASVLIAAGVVRVVFGETYRSDAGIIALQEVGVQVETLERDAR